MKLHILGSSSSGNCYLLIASNGDTLIIEAGISFSEVKEALNFDISKIISCIVSHRHGDHSKYAAEYIKNGIDVCSGLETLNSLKSESTHRMRVFENKKKYILGPFEVKPVDVVHDVQCFMFLIRHPESGLILFASDTMYLPCKVAGLNQIIIECNYSQDILDARLNDGDTIDLVRNRVISSHMEFNTTKDVLRANDLTGVNNIVLIHLSDGNSDAKLFKSEIENLTAKTVTIGDSGVCIPFDITAF